MAGFARVCSPLSSTLGVVAKPFPIPKLLEEWLRWVTWQSDPHRDESLANDFVGWDEFEWVSREHPEHAWSAILVTLKDPRSRPYLNILAAGPLESLLSEHGEAFIERVELEARSNPEFAWLLGGVWRDQMSEDVWNRVRAVWDRRGWDGIPRDDA